MLCPNLGLCRHLKSQIDTGKLIFLTQKIEIEIFFYKYSNTVFFYKQLQIEFETGTLYMQLSH